MRLQGVPLVTVSQENLQALVEHGVSEGRGLEYKQALPNNSDREKKEFLADVAAIANTDGGVLIYGVVTQRDANGQDTGVPQRCEGIELPNPDAELLRLSSILRDSLDPSLTLGLTLRVIPLDGTTRSVLVIGVERSLTGPHMVTFQKANQFWRRGEAGKYSPDTTELRRVFMESTSWIQEADRLHESRTLALRSKSYAPHFCLVHVLPLGRLSTYLSPRALTAELGPAVAPMMGAGVDWRHNAAGFKVYSTPHPLGPEHYVQWLRFGVWKGRVHRSSPNEVRSPLAST